MKKVFRLLTVCALVFGMAFTFNSCGGNDNNNPDNPENPEVDPNAPFVITISNITEHGVRLTFTPKDKTKSYFWGMEETNFIYANALTVSAFAGKDLANNFSDYDALEMSDFLDTGNKTYDIPSDISGFPQNLSSNTEYTVFVTHVEKGEQGNIVTGTVVYTQFTTK